MLIKVVICCLLIGVLDTNNAVSAREKESAATENVVPAGETSETEIRATETIAVKNETNKEKRQIETKDTSLYPNHRSDSALNDPEIAEETIYGAKPNQFIIRAVSPHQHQQHEEHHDPQLRNYQTATIQRSHNNQQQQQQQQQQQLDQSQEIQHFAYIQELSRNHPKVSASSLQAKSRTVLSKKGPTNRAQIQYSKPEEAEQHYAVAIQAPLTQMQQSRQYQPSPSQYQQEQQQQQQQQYSIIPEEHFLKLIEEELQARAYHDEQIRQQNAAPLNKLSPLIDRSGKGLGNYRQRLTSPALPPTQSIAAAAPVQVPTPTSPSEAQPTASLVPTPAYVQYVPRHRGGPKYLPLSQTQHQQKQYAEQDISDGQEPAAELPPQIADYQPQISYKTLPNHPLAKSSLEKEIEKLLSTNRPSGSAIRILDNSNEPSAVVNHHYQPQLQPQPQPQVLSNRLPKSYLSNTTPNSLLDANNQPFVPSLFRFSNYQTPTPIYPTQVPPQHVIEAKKLGPVVYPTQTTSTTAQSAQEPSQYYYQEASPNLKTIKNNPRPKQYDLKLLQPTAQLKQREKAIKLSTELKYTPQQSLVYDFNNQAPIQSHRQHNLHHQHQHQSQAQLSQTEFFPSQPDPSNSEPATVSHAHSQSRPNQPSTQTVEQPQTDFPQYALPAQSPSQSSIFVSQGTGVTTPSRPAVAVTHKKVKTIEDVKQLRLPQPGGKPLTQAEFQALVDAGYPVTAVPVPVPVPYEQYLKDHPQFRNQPLDYAQIMRNAQQQYKTRNVPRLGLASEPAVKIVSSPSESQIAQSNLDDGSITYLRPIQSAATNQRRHPRDNEKETKNAGDTKELENKNKNKNE